MILRVAILASLLLVVPGSASADWRTDLDTAFRAGLTEEPVLYRAVAEARPSRTRAGTLRFFGDSPVLAEAAVPAVLQRLSDGLDEPGVRRALAECLHRAPADWDVARLALAQSDGSAEVRAMLAAGLRWMDAGAAAPAFERLLLDPAPLVRAETVRAVARRADGADWASLLVPSLSDASPDVRLQAVKALAAVGSGVERARIEVLVNDADPRVVKAVRRALR
jgi:hypothetical protein